MTRMIGILVYDEVEVLDFAGPFEVFSTANRMCRRHEDHGTDPFRVAVIGESSSPVRARGGLTIQPDHGIDDAPDCDALIVPGGDESVALGRSSLMGWLRARVPEQTILASVCTGAFLLAEAGHLRRRRATTHHEDIARFRAAYPDLKVIEEVRWVDEDRVLTSAGVSAGIDMSLHLVARLSGDRIASETAANMAVTRRTG
jgi:transcriptional regulator GlxA family with amidase domain